MKKSKKSSKINEIYRPQKTTKKGLKTTIDENPEKRHFSEFSEKRFLLSKAD